MTTDLAIFEPIKLPDPRRPATLPSLPEWAARLSGAVRLELQMTPDGKSFEKEDILVLPPELMPSPEQRQAMTSHRDSLRSLLQDTPEASSAAETRVATSVTRLRSVLGGARNSELGEEGAAETYLVVLDDVPCWAVEAASWKWLKHGGGMDERGKSHNYVFAPDPGTLRNIALREVYGIGARIGTIQRILDAREYVDCSKLLAAGRASLHGINKAVMTGDLAALTFDEAVRLGSSDEKTNLPVQEAAE